MSAHPLLLDANGDYVADLFSSPKNTSVSSRAIWIFESDRTKAPSQIDLKTRESGEMRNPHSNSFVDLDNDGNADILVTSEYFFELWHDSGKKEVDNATKTFVHAKNVKLPKECGEESDTKCSVGQLAFADFDLDGKLDLIFPICHDGPPCSNSTLYFASASDLWNSPKNDETIFKPMTIDIKNLRFSFTEDPIYDALAPRVGDINLDGYPDLLLRMTNPTSLKMETHLLLNVPVIQEDEIIVSNLSRGFKLQNEVMDGLHDTVMATFFDLYENGMVDIILVKKSEEDSGSKSKYNIGAFTNITQDSDAYFVKVIVLSGK